MVTRLSPLLSSAYPPLLDTTPQRVDFRSAPPSFLRSLHGARATSVSRRPALVARVDLSLASPRDAAQSFSRIRLRAEQEYRLARGAILLRILCSHHCSILCTHRYAHAGARGGRREAGGDDESRTVRDDICENPRHHRVLRCSCTAVRMILIDIFSHAYLISRTRCALDVQRW
jgi:hypothetical protein